jgi:RNA polymerase sigma factor (sigma-70 family)
MSSPGTPTSRQAPRIPTRDPEPLLRAYSEHHNALYRYCRAILRHDHDAQDALQEAVVKALAAWERGPVITDIKPWLYRIAHNAAMDVLRARRSVEPVAEPPEVASEGLDALVERRERLAHLDADLAALPERQRSALVLRELNGLGHEEIALVLDSTSRAVKQTIYEARVALLDAEAGRGMTCATIQEALSDGDGRVRRGRRVRGHLRTCASCRGFVRAIERRPGDLAALVPPVAPFAAATILAHALGGAGSAALGGAAAAGGTALAGAGAAGTGALAGAGTAGGGAAAGAVAAAGSAGAAAVTAKGAGAIVLAVAALGGGVAAERRLDAPAGTPAATTPQPRPALAPRAPGPALPAAAPQPPGRAVPAAERGPSSSFGGRERAERRAAGAVAAAQKRASREAARPVPPAAAKAKGTPPRGTGAPANGKAGSPGASGSRPSAAPNRVPPAAASRPAAPRPPRAVRPPRRPPAATGRVPGASAPGTKAPRRATITSGAVKRPAAAVAPETNRAK